MDKSKNFKMKSTIFVLLTLLAFSANAQRRIDSATLAKPVMNKTNVPVKMTKTVPQPAPAPAPAPKSQTIPKTKPNDTQPALTDADYFLAGAVVRISSGNDNKEANASMAYFYVRPRNSSGFLSYKLEEYASELPSNQTVDLRLNRVAALASAQNSLKYYKQNGLSVLVAYANKSFCTDAWKINSVTVTLEFKDVNGNPAPDGYASKTISYPVSSGTLGFIIGCNPFWASYANYKFLGYGDQLAKMLLKTDEYLNPLPATLLAWNKDDVN
jgi:hypothetical protein